jgi:hypothetical protein
MTTEPVTATTWRCLTRHATCDRSAGPGPAQTCAVTGQGAVGPPVTARPGSRSNKLNTSHPGKPSHRQFPRGWQRPQQQAYRARRPGRLRQQLGLPRLERLTAVRSQPLRHLVTGRNRHHVHHPPSQPDHTRPKPHPHHHRRLLLLSHGAAAHPKSAAADSAPAWAWRTRAARPAPAERPHTADNAATAAPPSPPAPPTNHTPPRTAQDPAQPSCPHRSPHDPHHPPQRRSPTPPADQPRDRRPDRPFHVLVGAAGSRDLSAGVQPTPGSDSKPLVQERCSHHRPAQHQPCSARCQTNINLLSSRT